MTRMMAEVSFLSISHSKDANQRNHRRRRSSSLGLRNIVLIQLHRLLETQCRITMARRLAV
jgi:hypothetical protein